jgi:CheY-like chemotaxis protein
MTEQQTESIRVVAVEDNPADIRLVEEGIETIEIGIDLDIYNSGGRAIEELRSIDGDVSAERPDLVLLDLNLPGKSGFDVLRSIRTETTLQNVPVVIVSSSKNSSDMRKAYELSANAYVVKPSDPDEYIQMVRTTIDFWKRHTMNASHD